MVDPSWAVHAVSDAHAQPVAVAVAPGSWVVAGEHVDSYGGTSVVRLTSVQAAAAVTPRMDGVFELRILNANDQVTQHTWQASHSSAPENTTADPLACRIASLTWSMSQRQLLSREGVGATITVACPPELGESLGGSVAVDSAVALALAAMHPGASVDDAPERARIADACILARGDTPELPADRARFVATLRGQGSGAVVLNFSEGSATTVRWPSACGDAALLVTSPHRQSPAEVRAEIRRRENFIDAAAQAFGAHPLALLPDVTSRVAAWLDAVHDVHGPQGVPSVHEAQRWLHYWTEESQRASKLVAELRVHHATEALQLVAQSHQDTACSYGIGSSAVALGELCRLYGALAVHTAGDASSVICLLPSDEQEDCAARLAERGLSALTVYPGEAAHLL